MNPGLMSLQDMTVIELGCRKGGGLNYLNQTARPQRIIGADSCEDNIKFSKRNYGKKENTDFLVMSKETQDKNQENFDETLMKEFGIKQTDLAISIESTLGFEDLDEYFSQVARVLKKNGQFFYANL